MKICKVCKAEYEKKRMGQVVCSPSCALSLASSKRAKAVKVAMVKDKRDTKVKLDKFKTRAKWIAEVQVVFNQFIRLRDQLAGHACISSGKPLDWTGNGVDAGHYRSRGSAPHLRFDERNCHAQSKHDNRYGAGNVVGYRVGLIERIGLEAVEALEADQEPSLHTVDQLKEIKKTYSAKAKELRAQA